MTSALFLYFLDTLCRGSDTPLICGPYNQALVYRVTVQVDTNLLLTPKLKLCSSKWASRTFVLQSTGGFNQPEQSPCTWSLHI